MVYIFLLHCITIIVQYCYLLKFLFLVSFQILYKLKTTKVFERPKPRSIDELDEDPFAIDNVAFCLNTRVLAVAGSSGHVIVYNFKKNDASVDLNVSLYESC